METAIKHKPRIPKKFLGAFKVGHRMTSREFIEDDYAYELLRLAQSGSKKAEEALEILTKFNNEYYKCVFKKGRGPRNFHKKCNGSQNELMRREYARKNDVMTRRSEPIDVVDFSGPENTEDALIFLIDLKNEMLGSKKQ